MKLQITIDLTVLVDGKPYTDLEYIGLTSATKALGNAVSHGVYPLSDSGKDHALDCSFQLKNS